MKQKILIAAVLGCLAVLLVSGAVFAEGETPPEVPPEETAGETPPVTEPVPEPAVEPAADLTAGVLETPEAPEEALEQASVDTGELVEALAAADVILADEDGEELDLASDATADAIAIGDPWWMVGTTKYATVFNLIDCPTGTTAGVTCWASGAPISEALNRMVGMGKLPSDGKLHVEADTYADVININGSGSILANFKGIVGEPSVEGVHSCDLTGSVTVQNVVSGFTLSGFDINGFVIMQHNTGTIVLEDLFVHGDTGINIADQKGTIKLNQVRAEENDNYGAYLNNTTSSSAGIEIRNSSFNFNTFSSNLNAGLVIHSNGPVMLDGVSASQMDGDGIDVFDASSLTIKNSVISGNFTDPDNSGWGYGLYIVLGHRNAPITLENVLVNGNENDGIYLQTQGKVTLKGVVASGNGGQGAHLDNCVDNGTGVCVSTYFNTVSVTDSYFENNSGGDGLEIKSKGAVTLTSVHAYNNTGGGYGVLVNNCMFESGACQGTGGVTITSILTQGVGGINYFGVNDGYGLYVFSKGVISLSNFTAEWNGIDGVHLDNNQTGATGSVTVKSTLTGWVNYVYHNVADGLDISSNGTILVDMVNARANDESGLEIDNDYTGVVKNVTVSNCKVEYSLRSGITVGSNGNVTIINSSASYSDLGDAGAYSGLYINNSGGLGNVVIKSTNAKNYYNFDYNSQNGVEIITNGTVNISNAIANYNADTVDDSNNDGFNIGGAIDPKTITMTRCIADGNGWNGLQIQSQGFVLLTNVSAHDNANNGIIAYAGAAFSLKTASGTPDNELMNNGDPFNADGLYANAAGSITIQNTIASYNNAYGFALHNAPSLTAPVVIKLSTADQNHYGGIYINTAGNLTVTDTSADDNDSWGLYVDTDGTVTINCTKPLGYCSFSSNGTGDGLEIYARKTITISKIVANDNGNDANDHGMDLHSYFTPSPIILSNVSVEGNWLCGILADTENNVTITNVLARYNRVGVSVGTGGDPVNNVTILGTNWFDTNQSGLEVYALGTVNISNVTAQYQTSGSGVYVVSTGEGKTVTLNNILSRYNHDDGVSINSQGNVNLNSVRSMSNGTAATDGEGLLLVMTDQEDIVTIKNSVFTYNAGNGIDANVYGPPTDYSKFKLLNTIWLGNDADNDGNADLIIW